MSIFNCHEDCSKMSSEDVGVLKIPALTSFVKPEASSSAHMHRILQNFRSKFSKFGFFKKSYNSILTRRNFSDPLLLWKGGNNSHSSDPEASNEATIMYSLLPAPRICEHSCYIMLQNGSKLLNFSWFSNHDVLKFFKNLENIVSSFQLKKYHNPTFNH